MGVDALIRRFFKKRLKQIQRFRENPLAVQEEVFHYLIRKAASTEWGRHHDYHSIRSLTEFKERVPIQEYPDLEPWIERMMKGEENILWPTPVKWFAQSSGTTSSRSKFIPMSKEALHHCHYKGGKDLLALYYQQNPKSGLYRGKSLVLGGSSQPVAYRKDAYVGDLSSIIVKNLPFWAEMRRVPKKDIALMGDWEEKMEKMAQKAAREKVTNMAGVPSWTLVLLKRILEITGKSNIREVWPDLELFMHGGVNFAPYRDKFETLIPYGTMHYYQNYNASEGFFGIQDRNKSDDMLLMLDYGIYFEFMPMEELGNDNPKTLSLREVETDTNYAPVISTNAGLWRYMIGDTIRFTSLAPYRIQVSGRTKHFINTFGEELIVENAMNGIQKACERTGAIVEEFSAAPIYMDTDSQGAHEWLVEFERKPDAPESFRDELDAALKAINTDYEAKRSYDLTLRKPVLNVLPKGSFYEWMRQRGKLGGQNKVPKLSNDRGYIEDILAFQTPEKVVS